jgi:hypothetical protein
MYLLIGLRVPEDALSKSRHGRKSQNCLRVTVIDHPSISGGYQAFLTPDENSMNYKYSSV